MSPVEIAEVVKLRLASEIADDLAALGRLAGVIAQLRDPFTDARAEWTRSLALAFEVERYYTAVEALLTRVVRALDGDVPSGPASHLELLRAASVALDGGRPRVVSAEALAELKELLKFRHLARHGYEIEPDLARMDEHATRVGRAQAALAASMDSLVGWLKSC